MVLIASLSLVQPASALVTFQITGDPETEHAAPLERDTVLLFWNPSCGFCRAMHKDLLAWEVERGAGVPALVVLSSGEPEAVRAEGFRSRVALDPDGGASSAFEAGGTPMAVLLDGDGRVASILAAGADDVFGFLRARIPAS